MLFDSVWFNFQCLQHHTHVHPANRWDIGKCCRLHNIANPTVTLSVRAISLHITSLYVRSIGFILDSIRFGCSACAVTHVVPHAHNAPWYVCVTVFGRWQPMLVWLIIATYIRIIGYSVLACVCVCVLPFNRWLMLPISAHTGIERESDCAKKTVIVSMAHVLIWIKGEKNQDQKKTRHTQQHWLQNAK